MDRKRPFGQAIETLRTVGLRPTRQRMALCKLLFDGRQRHLTAETLHAEALAADLRMSLATVYNTLHQFTAAGLLRQVVVDGTKTYFDTNTEDHHHFYRESDGTLLDIPGESVVVKGLPASPDGTSIARVDVIVRLADTPDA